MQNAKWKRRAEGGLRQLLRESDGTGSQVELVTALFLRDPNAEFDRSSAREATPPADAWRIPILLDDRDRREWHVLR